MKKFIATILTLSLLATPVCLNASAWRWPWQQTRNYCEENPILEGMIDLLSVIIGKTPKSSYKIVLKHYNCSDYLPTFLDIRQKSEDLIQINNAIINERNKKNPNQTICQELLDREEKLCNDFKFLPLFKGSMCLIVNFLRK